MRVALFTDTYPPEVNGAARALGRWVAYLEQQGIACKVFAPTDPRAVAAAEQGRVERFGSVPFLFNSDSRVALPNMVRAGRLVREFRPTIIHAATTFGMGLAGRYFAGKLGVPFIASYHTFWDQYLPQYHLGWIVPTQWRFMRWFHRPCAKVLVPTETAKAVLAGHGLTQLDIWSRGVDAARFRPAAGKAERRETLKRFGADPDKFTLLYVGRIAKEKSVETLLAAYRMLDDAVRGNAQLLLAGGGPLLGKLARDNRDSSVHFFGFLEGEALSGLYAAADLFVFPSATETFGNVVLEAMASGLPVVGAAAGGVGEIIGHGDTGWLCEPGDAASLRDAITLLTLDAALRRRLAAAGLAYARTQSWEAINARLLERYREVLGRMIRNS